MFLPAHIFLKMINYSPHPFSARRSQCKYRIKDLKYFKKRPDRNYSSSREISESSVGFDTDCRAFLVTCGLARTDYVLTCKSLCLPAHIHTSGHLNIKSRNVCRNLRNLGRTFASEKESWLENAGRNGNLAGRTPS
jgi:hypothetical protein